MKTYRDKLVARIAELEPLFHKASAQANVLGGALSEAKQALEMFDAPEVILDSTPATASTAAEAVLPNGEDRTEAR